MCKGHTIKLITTLLLAELILPLRRAMPPSPLVGGNKTASGDYVVLWGRYDVWSARVATATLFYAAGHLVGSLFVWGSPEYPQLNSTYVPTLTSGNLKKLEMPLKFTPKSTSATYVWLDLCFQIHDTLRATSLTHNTQHSLSLLTRFRFEQNFHFELTAREQNNGCCSFSYC